METVLLLMGLGVGAVQDLKWKKVWLPLLWGVTVALLMEKWIGGGDILGFLLCSLGFLLCFTLIGRLSGGQIGQGDAFVFGMTGAGLGWRENVALVYVTFFLAFLAGIFCLTVKRKGRSWELPLVPFALLAYVLLLAQSAV